MDIKRYLAVGALGFALILNGCGQRPALLENDSGKADVIRNELKYAATIAVDQSGLKLDYLNDDIAISPDGKLGVLAASKVPKGIPKGQQVDYETHLVLVDLINGKVSSLDQGQYISPIQWSPRGDRILYRKDDNLYTIDPVSGRKSRIAGRAYCGSISPDGTRVAFIQRGKGLFVSGIDGTAVKQLTREPGDWYPVWYPDGRTLFYFADRKIELGDGAGRLQGLGRIDIETGRADILLPEEKGKYRRAEWVIPGKTLLINKGWDDGFYEMVVNVEKGEVYQLGENAGTKMYATTVSKAEGVVYKAQGSKITGIDANGQESVSFSLDQPPGLRFSRDSGVAVSPDGQLVAYLSPERLSGNGKNGGRQIWVVNSDGTKPVALNGEIRGNRIPVWTPGSKHLVVIETANGSDANRGIALRIIKVESTRK